MFLKKTDPFYKEVVEYINNNYNIDKKFLKYIFINNIIIVKYKIINNSYISLISGNGEECSILLINNIIGSYRNFIIEITSYTLIFHTLYDENLVRRLEMDMTL